MINVKHAAVKHCYTKYVWESWHLYCQWFFQLKENDQTHIRFQWRALNMQQHLTEMDKAWQAVVGKAMHEVYLYELEMYLAKVEAEAVERELKEALRQQAEHEKKKWMKAKEQQEALARWATHNTS